MVRRNPLEESCQQEAFTTSILRSPTSSDRSRSTSTYSGRSDGPRRSGIRPTEARRRSFTSCDKKPAMVVSACVQPTVARTATTTSASNTSPSRLTDEEVDEAHARCLASGANVHFPPEEDRDEPGYYAFFAFDPDGIR